MTGTGTTIYCKFCRKGHSLSYHAVYTTSLIDNFIIFSDLHRCGAKSLEADLPYAMWSFKSYLPEFSSDGSYILYRDEVKNYNQIIVDEKGSFLFKRRLGEISDLYEAMWWVTYLQSKPQTAISACLPRLVAV